MKKYILIFILIISGILSCAAQGKFIVTKIGEEPESYKERLIYSLPHTVLLVTINFESEFFIPGPYRRFSEKFLGIKEFIDVSDTRWKITSADIKSFPEPDPLHFYSINMIKGEFKGNMFIELSKEGLILNPDKEIGFGLESNPGEKIITPPYFTDISMEENLIEISDTLYKTILKDSTFVRIPVLRTQLEAKSLERKAEDAADFIINVRTKRFEIETGVGEDPAVFPNGDAMTIAIRELNKLENEYLSMFIGKVLTRKFTQSFIITPSGKSEIKTIIKFSDKEGILPANSVQGENVSIEFSPSGNTDLLKKNLLQSPDDKLNTLYYRIPEVASVKLLQNEKLFYEGRMTLYQAGSMMSLPVGK